FGSFCRYGVAGRLHSFPTRRSSDLTSWRHRRLPRRVPRAPGGRAALVRLVGAEHSFRVAWRGGGRGPHLRVPLGRGGVDESGPGDRKSTRLNSSHQIISYAVFWLTK